MVSNFVVSPWSPPQAAYFLYHEGKVQTGSIKVSCKARVG
jgi:hypothetical protein